MMYKLLLIIFFLFASALHAENFKRRVIKSDYNNDGVVDHILYFEETYERTVEYDDNGKITGQTVTAFIKGTGRTGRIDTFYEADENENLHYSSHTIRPHGQHGPYEMYYKQGAGLDKIEFRQPTYQDTVDAVSQRR